MEFSRNHLISYIILVMISSAASLTFNLPNIGPFNLNSDIIGVGAYISNSGIQVTPDEIGSDRNGKCGRAIFVREFHLWDKKSGELASFSTNFTFVIDSRGNRSYADGLTFFLAQNTSDMFSGGSMGLPFSTSAGVNNTNQFVAVEFDTYWNQEWDPKDSRNISGIDDHVGISINSLSSVSYMKWLSNIIGGGACQAWITYDSSSLKLSVSFTEFINNTAFRKDGLEYIIDLRRVLPERVIIGFSAATGVRFQKNNVKSWSFNSSEIEVVKNNEPPVIPPTPSPDLVKGNNSKIGLIVGLPVVIIFLILLVYILWRIKKKKTREEEEEETGFDVEMNKEFEMGTGPKRFTYQELARSTGDFAENEKLGEGGFGGVYRGFLKDSNMVVAVKRVSKSSKQGIKEYASEVRIISKLRHRNLVQLTGWCHQKSELLLVYEYMENGSLDTHLFKAQSLLTWGTRYKIAHGLASALLYLHEEWEQCVLHRDIKSSNVMLDSNFNAKLGDFGLAKLVDHEKDSGTTMLAGTLGYMAPECFVTGKVSKESDVFSFGVVALEIACGRKTIEYKAQENQIRLVEWVWRLYGTDSLLQAVDPLLGLDFKEEEIKRLMIVGLWCAHPDSEHRPSMRQVIQVLNSEASLPILPSKMPVASYATPPMSFLSGVTSSSSNTDSSNQTKSSTASSYSSSASLSHSTQ
ncbi:L-type lectin-domain containing receptor kinase IX.1-like protein [Tanacetum coccineum]